MTASGILNEAKDLGRDYARSMGRVCWWWFKVCLTVEIAIYFAGCCHYEHWLTVDEWIAVMDDVMRCVTAGAK